MSDVATEALTNLGGKYLTFHLAEEEYGLEILKVREIIGVQEITTVPRAPDFVKGVINLRGRIIPVIDLRMKFDFSEKEYDKETCIIVVAINEILVGLIVDTVSEVVDVDAQDIEEPPSFGTTTSTDFIIGMGKIKGHVSILLNVENILSNEVTDLMAEIASDDDK